MWWSFWNFPPLESIHKSILKMNKIKHYRSIQTIIYSLLLINPAISYLFFNNWAIAITISILSVLIALIILEKAKVWLPYYLNSLFFIGILLYSEVVFTFGYSEHVIKNLYEPEGNYYFNKPFLSKKIIDKEYRISYFTNSQGFRISGNQDPEQEFEKCDWLFLGDSYTQGAQVEYEQLYTTDLYRNFPDKIITNAGISGFGIIESYELYKNKLSKLSPSKVFLQICSFNDFMNVQENRIGFSDYLMNYSNLARTLLYSIKYPNPEELPLGRWTEPFYPEKKENIDYNVFYIEASDRKKRDWNTLKSYLEKFKLEVEKNGGKLIILLVPTKEQIHYKFFQETISSFNITPNELNMNKPNELMQKWVSELDIELIDLKLPFEQSNQQYFFEYDEHLNVSGHHAISEMITHKYQKTSLKYKYLSNTNSGDRYPTEVNIDSNLFVLYQTFRDGNHELFMSDTNFKQEYRLTTNDIDETHPIKHPFFHQIIFTQGKQNEYNTHVYSLDPLTQERKKIMPAESTNTYSSIPHFNKFGDKISLSTWYYNNNKISKSTIRIIDLDTDSISQITPSSYNSWRPIFHPNDSIIFYISDLNGNYDLFSTNIYSQETKQLTNTPFDEWDPSLSNSGQHLVYAAQKDNNWDLFMINTSTLNKIQLTHSKGNDWDPSFSIDNNHIYFAATYGSNNGIYKISLKDYVLP